MDANKALKYSIKELLPGIKHQQRRNGNGTPTLKQGVKLYKNTKKLVGYAKDLDALLEEPTKGNAVRILSKRLLKELFKLGGWPGKVLQAFYGDALNFMIDVIYTTEKAHSILTKANHLVKVGITAKLRAEKGIEELLVQHAYSESKYMQGPISYTLFLYGQRPELKRTPDEYFSADLAKQLALVNTRRVNMLDKDILCFLAVDGVLRAIKPAIQSERKKVKDPTNIIEQVKTTPDLLHHLDALSKHEAGNMHISSNIDKLIRLRNKWAQWSGIPIKSRAMYMNDRLPYYDFENI